MTTDQMLKTLIDCYDEMMLAKKVYDQFTGGGATQAKKNRLFKEYKIKEQQLDNAVFNIKQFVK